MRMNVDLIAELERKIPNFKMVALATGFEDHTEYIWGSDQKKIEKLTDLMIKGGEPIGLLGIHMKDKTLTAQCRVLEEYKDEPWANQFLESLNKRFYTACTKPRRSVN